MSIKFDPTLLAQVRAQSKLGDRNFILQLQDTLALEAYPFVAWLGQVSLYPVMKMEDIHACTPEFSVLKFSDCLQRECIALRQQDQTLLVVMANPFDDALREWLLANIQTPFEIYLAHLTDIQAYMSKQEESQQAMENWSDQADMGVAAGENIEVISLQSISEDSSPVVRLVHATLYDALKAGVSDIHLETTHSGLSIKYRIDGILSHVSHVQGIETADQVISRLKVISELDIAERRIPQDGRFKVFVGERPIDFRVSIMPSIFGEDAVLRILDKKTLTDELQGLNLEVLGFSGETLSKLRTMCKEPYGMVLVTGPTGSGKTTTLYAAISEINHGTQKIITIEDPVEYQLNGILQIPVNEKKGLTFAKGLRSILRHDPDKILVGEIRDSETAQIAIQSALTGHLVFTTVHANNVFDVLGRFTHMGVDPYSFVSALNGILAQRLIRINCPDCVAPIVPDAELLASSGLSDHKPAEFNFMAGKGCGKCRGSGFKGRKAIAELLVLNDELREMIINRASVRAIKEVALRQNTQFLRHSAILLVKSGETTLEEINRVTFVES